jgi:hypothetical protein
LATNFGNGSTRKILPSTLGITEVSPPRLRNFPIAKHIENIRLLSEKFSPAIDCGLFFCSHYAPIKNPIVFLYMYEILSTEKRRAEALPMDMGNAGTTLSGTWQKAWPP